MPADEKYSIVDGVRRAKAAEKLGYSEIMAEVRENDTPVDLRLVPVDKLYSPEKPVIETSGTGFARWRNVFRQMSNGTENMPPIIVTEGAIGTPLSEVIVEGVDDLEAFF